MTENGNGTESIETVKTYKRWRGKKEGKEKGEREGKFMDIIS